MLSKKMAISHRNSRSIWCHLHLQPDHLRYRLSLRDTSQEQILWEDVKAEKSNQDHHIDLSASYHVYRGLGLWSTWVSVCGL